MGEVKFFSDGDRKVIRPEIVDGEALDLARKFTDRSSRIRLNPSQLRNFYGEVKAVETAMKAQGGTIGILMPRIKLLKAKVAYAASRNLVPPVFKDWLSDCVSAVKDERDFKAFLLHFEAVVGFCYGEGLKD